MKIQAFASSLFQYLKTHLRKIRQWGWSQWLKVAGIALGSVMLGAGLLVAMIALEWLGPLPDQDELKGLRNHKASEIYAADGKLLGTYFLENRTEVALSEVAPTLIEALVATEDVRFYQHRGVDGRSLARVAVKSVLLQHASAGGGSTLSQQLAKNLFPRRSYAIFSLPINKIREMMIARRLENTYEKDKILELYLNTVPFGGNLYGIGAASKRFFQRSPAQLTVEQGAVLVGMLKATTTYNPARNPDRSLQRRNVVLDQWGHFTSLPHPQLDSLKSLPLGLNYRNQTEEVGLAPYFRQQAAQSLRKWFQEHPGPDNKPYNLYTDGLKIYTTIDRRMQYYAEEAVAKHMKSLQTAFDKHWKGRSILEDNDPTLLRGIRQSERYQGLRAAGLSDEDALIAFDQPEVMSYWSWEGTGEKEMTPRDSVRHHLSFLQAGFLAVEPKTGYVRAWVGGIHHPQFKYDHVTSQRQVGSTFKPIVYAAAIANGMDPCEYFPNEKVVYSDYENWAPGNADGKYEGYYSLAGGLTNSVNTVSAAVMMKVGVEKAWNFAQQFGFTSEIPKSPSMVLGTADLTLQEMVGAYTAFANRGVRSLPIYITKIEDAHGNVIVEWPEQPATHRVMDATQADMVAHMLQSVVQQGTASRLRRTYGLTMDLGGKTGTSQDQADGWFIGISPNLVVGAWVGGEARNIRFRSLGLGQGANTALPICGLFLHKVQRDPRYKSIATATFPSPGISALQSMDCALYQERLPSENGLDELFMILKERRIERALRNEENAENPDFQENKQRRKDIWDKLIPRRNR